MTAQNRRAALGKSRAWLRASSRLFILLLSWGALSAHVGTNQVVLEGTAGAYPVRVSITPPGVVPAQVPILVRVLSGTPTRVTVRAAQWNLGTKGAPPAEEAKPVRGEPNSYVLDLWFMTASTYAVHVAVEGPDGSGELIVPLQTAATRTLGMQRALGIILAVLGTALIAGFITIVGAAAREGSLQPGETVPAPRRRTARIAMGVTAGILALEILGGWKWWQSEEAAYRRRLFKPIASQATVSAVHDTNLLAISITDSAWRTNGYSPLIPDHGKLMHLFVVRSADTEAIAHLHPLRVSPDSFETPLPPLPPGRYLMFADVLLQSGAQRTLTDTIDITAPTGGLAAGEHSDRPPLPALDPDDAWRATAAVPLGNAATLAGGGTLTLVADATPVVGRDLRLKATVVDEKGSRVSLQPYMGMDGHAMVMRRDGGIFMHIHPMGTASMGAQQQLEKRERGDTLNRGDVAPRDVASNGKASADSMMAAQHSLMNHDSGVVAFPFAFPTPGDYRVFVQVRRNGRVETAAFSVNVQ